MMRDSSKANFQTRWPDFEGELQRILAMDTSSAEDFVVTDANHLAGYNLSSEARTLLVEASQDSSGLLLCIRLDVGFFVHTNGRTFGEEGQPRSQASWKQAVGDLERHGLLESRDDRREAFAVTALGYQVADVLKE